MIYIINLMKKYKKTISFSKEGHGKRFLTVLFYF